jgi:hypothetical protein
MHHSVLLKRIFVAPCVYSKGRCGESDNHVVCVKMRIITKAHISSWLIETNLHCIALTIN